MGDITPSLPETKLETPSATEIKILVTGYAPFHIRFPVNASWSIASTLPSVIPATATCPRIKLIVPPEPIEVAYHTVTAFAEKWLGECDYDLVLHIGLAAGRKFFTLEQQSMRAPYWEKKDVNGRVFSQEETQKLWPADLFPPVLKPTFDMEDLWRRWRDNVKIVLDVRPSNDPGNYLCGFIYYYSMAYFWNRKTEERPVVFLHVPDLPSEETVEGGRQVAIGLIRAMVSSRQKRGIYDPMKMGEIIVPPTGSIDMESDDSMSCTGDDDLEWSYKR